jgi:hypothetical protein
MILLAAERAGPYVRALAAGVRALDGGPDHPSAVAVANHLAALDPALSGDLLLPASVSQASGMPSFAWMERALAEGRADVALPDDREIARISALDAALGARWTARRRLRQHLQGAEMLAPSAMRVFPRRLGATTEIVVISDRIAADDRWIRVRVDIRSPGPQGTSALRLEAGAVRTDAGVAHLLARAAPLPLAAMASVLAHGLGGRVLRLARGAIGPLWSPGVALPAGVPKELGGGRILHLTHEVLGEVGVAGVRDPLSEPVAGEWIERRFAASPAVTPALRAWLEAAGAPCAIARW